MHNTRRLVAAAISLAILVICSQITIPIPTVPLTLQTLAVGFIAVFLPIIDGLLVIIVYLILGTLGLPIFAGLHGGLSYLLAPAGGYLFGFIAFVLITKLFLRGKSQFNLWLALLLGDLSQLICGTAGLQLALHQSWPIVVGIGILPYIIPELIKITLLTVIAQRLLPIWQRKW
ncbi:biotin transporter BioY [Bombilactobacillus thymidiniphilus]|uniref:Biotin transporter n=1 Tax=Bombilactobacillus thymidiniphilus TaxID=2923363 RepID=A0ABY4PF99_9LACO|nr:biotin transporter BioY [Bombilactobacillus thymidiniphilus]UQS84255.1 biotin transporter BioY [Bombilactobacillus thymidiniphilus]